VRHLRTGIPDLVWMTAPKPLAKERLSDAEAELYLASTSLGSGSDSSRDILASPRRSGFMCWSAVAVGGGLTQGGLENGSGRQERRKVLRAPEQFRPHLISSHGEFIKLKACVIPFCSLIKAVSSTYIIQLSHNPPHSCSPWLNTPRTDQLASRKCIYLPIYRGIGAIERWGVFLNAKMMLLRVNSKGIRSSRANGFLGHGTRHQLPLRTVP
jgi:hypothetical protein